MADWGRLLEDVICAIVGKIPHHNNLQTLRLLNMHWRTSVDGAVSGLAISGSVKLAEKLVMVAQRFPKLKSLALQVPQHQPDIRNISRLTALTGLTSLDLSKMRVVNNDLCHVASLSSLTTLHLGFSNCVDQSVFFILRI